MNIKSIIHKHQKTLWRVSIYPQLKETTNQEQHLCNHSWACRWNKSKQHVQMFDFDIAVAEKKKKINLSHKVKGRWTASSDGSSHNNGVQNIHHEAKESAVESSQSDQWSLVPKIQKSSPRWKSWVHQNTFANIVLFSETVVPQYDDNGGQNSENSMLMCGHVTGRAPARPINLNKKHSYAPFRYVLYGVM